MESSGVVRLLYDPDSDTYYCDRDVHQIGLDWDGSTAPDGDDGAAARGTCLP